MRILSFFALYLWVIIPLSANVTIDWVTVADAGNAADSGKSIDPYGAVPYEYKIARNETTISQYAGFLNATAASDPYGLWNSNLESDPRIAGISRSGSDGSYSYSVMGSGERPITYVSWFDAARFANWLHNGQGSGSTETGAYNLNGAMSGIFNAQPGASVRLPTEDEWYKAAYYDPEMNGGTGGYWNSTVRASNLSGNTIGVAGSANYYDGDYVGSGSSSYPTGNVLTDVGAYGLNSQSYYGTNDQGGNVMEWSDGIHDNDFRRVRGGSWFSIEGFTYRYSNNYGTPSANDIEIGFRLASIPEPSSWIFGVMTALVLGCRRRR